MAENPKVVGREIYELAVEKKVKFPSTLTEAQREQKCFNVGQINKDDEGMKSTTKKKPIPILNSYPRYHRQKLSG